ncbi:hypothetical protein [uncultured Acetobacteroides sp.]|uniref:hypothetical protein n=1 Tax=uncultured Acetobacteroides sp. TaxID=1760811 RepID=UPI0029F4CA6D|nr:hypothetical protein [uncultured Acetobacteroides sp.]
MRGVIRLIGLAGVSIMALTMCTKEDPVRNYTIEKETRQWTAFKPGSYWVYQQEGTNVTDSSYVVLFSETEVSGTDEGGNRCLAQQIEVRYACNDGYQSTKVENLLPRGNSLRVSAYDKSSRPISSIDMILVFPLSFVNQTDSPYFSIISENEKVSLDSEVLTNVVHVKCSVKGVGGILANTTYENEYWIARNRWIVKMKVKNPESGNTETWNLIRYKVIQ